MDYNESQDSEVYTFINGDEKITATRFKKGGNFLVIRRSVNNDILGQAKHPEKVFLRLELEYSELTDSQSDPE
jgi:hypothetical protein